MIRHKTTVRYVSVFLVLLFIFELVLPSTAWALTSGPTSPEASSFEPVDTTDMVNLASGDFNYNIPVLEVPGPSGGYPLALSYHAGISPDEEASWVGLGWTLNPGSISRFVNGFPDDQVNALISDRFFWEGGERTTVSIGITKGISGLAGVTAGLAFSSDTYQGFGAGMSIGVNFGLPIKGSDGKPVVGINVTGGVGPFGGAYMSAGISTGLGATGINFNANVTTNFVDISAGVGVSSLGTNMGASISSAGGGVTSSASVGFATVSSNRVGKLTTQGFGFTPPLPLISLSFSYQRYWIDETTNVRVNGALHTPTSQPSTGFDSNGFDSYTIADPQISLTENIDTDKVLGGSFINYDHFSVQAQGVGGQIRPYSYKNLIFRQNSKRGSDYQIKQYEYNQGYQNRKIEFRFVGDFSNQYRNTAGSLASGSPPLIPLFGSGEITGEMATATDGFKNGHLSGSRHVEWYTNDQILGLDLTKNAAQEGLIECRASGFHRNISPKKQIGAFKITNESGVTYHFALPAYSIDEYQYSENINRASGHTFSEVSRKERYAYTWHLTAITGPDFVDRGPQGVPDGVLSELDWGYWVEFEYGLWSDTYRWRNPGVGLDQDIDNNFQNFSEGRKEVYYLDAIRTKTHSAFFIKAIRNDAKGTSSPAKSRVGGYIAQAATTRDVGCYVELGPPSNLSYPIYRTVNYFSRPVSSLRLDSIFLIPNTALKQLTISKSGGSQMRQAYSYPWGPLEQPGTCSPIVHFYSINDHFYQNILDVYDLSSFSLIRDKIIKKIGFGFDYELTPETPNSYPTEVLFPQPPPTLSSAYQLTGKLTLKSVDMVGKHGIKSLPPTKFTYDKPGAKGQGIVTSLNGSDTREFVFNTSSSDLIDGDIIRFSDQGRDVYALVFSRHGQQRLRIVGRALPRSGIAVQWVVTKNPPYFDELRDEWGMYKPDFIPQTQKKFDYRFTTDISSGSTDVWTLRSIQSPLGSKIHIDYESDEYVNATLFDGRQFGINAMFWTNEGYQIRLYDPVEVIEDEFKVGDTLKLTALIQHQSGISAKTLTDELRVLEKKTVTVHGRNFLQFTVTCVGGWSIPGSECPLFQQSVNGIYAGFVSVSGREGIVRKGGGIRVKSLTTHQDATTRSTHYSYQNGVTSYEPGLSPVPIYTNNYSWDGALLSIRPEKYAFERKLLEKFSRLLQLSREIPAPGVIYGTVEVRESVDGRMLPNRSIYEFVTFSESMLPILHSPEQTQVVNNTYQGINYKKVRKRDVNISNISSHLGQLKKVVLTDDFGNKISETKNLYLTDLATSVTNPAIYSQLLHDKFGSQGVIDETVMDARFARQNNGEYHLYGVVSRRHYLPVIKVGEVSINYKTGAKTENQIRAFDFYSGAVIEELSYDGYGNTFLTKTKPAYRVYSQMGLMGTGGKNMLTQQTEKTIFKVRASDPTEKLGVVASHVTTWSDQIPVLGTTSGQPGIWRTSGSFSFVGPNDVSANVDGLITGYQPFDYNNESDDRWQKQSQITLYDVNSHALEVYDKNQVYASTKMDLGNGFVLSTATNATYREQAYSGAEEEPVPSQFGMLVFGGGVYCIGSRSDNEAHTGEYSVRQSPDQPAFKYFLVPRQNTYRMSVWSTANQVSFKHRLDNQPAIVTLPTSKVGSPAGDEDWGWKLFQADVTITDSHDNLEVWCEAVGEHAYFDDFRFHPLKANFNSYVYNKWGELTFVLDNNNLFTRYEYDAMGRLKATYKETLNPQVGSVGIAKVSEYEYNYGSTSSRTVALTASSTGLTGTVSPSGVSHVSYMGKQAVEVRETCTNGQRLQRVRIDNKIMTRTNGTYLLFDGTLLTIQGNVYTFSNMQAPHSLVAEFASTSPSGPVGVSFCQSVSTGDMHCFTGFYEYGYYDVCGQLQYPLTVVGSRDEIPADVRNGDLPLNCCSANLPPTDGQITNVCPCH